MHVHENRGRPLALALAITSVYFVAEVVGGILTNSLALLSDAGHMFSDIAALGLSLFAFRMSRRPATAKRTYGYHRVEILAALINGLTLWLIVGIIFHEAYHRFLDPPEVQSLGMLVVAALGLGVNVAAGFILYGSDRESLNLRGAFLHVVGDALGSEIAVSFWQLPELIEVAEKTGLSASRYKMQYALLLSRPLLLVAMVVLAATVSLRSFRSGGMQTMVLVGMVGSIGFFLLTEVSRQIGVAGLVSPILAVWLPIGLALLVSLTVLLHQEDG